MNNLALDNELGEAYTSLGLLKQEKYEQDGAETAYKKAISLNPNYATAYHWYGSLLADMGNFPQALEKMQKALTLDPLSLIINSNVAGYHARLGMYDDAL